VNYLKKKKHDYMTHLFCKKEVVGAASRKGAGGGGELLVQIDGGGGKLLIEIDWGELLVHILGGVEFLCYSLYISSGRLLIWCSRRGRDRASTTWKGWELCYMEGLGGGDELLCYSTTLVRG
jgi:hypothetical protein